MYDAFFHTLDIRLNERLTGGGSSKSISLVLSPFRGLWTGKPPIAMTLEFSQQMTVSEMQCFQDF